MAAVIKVWAIIITEDMFDRCHFEHVDDCDLTAVILVWLS